MGRFGMTTLRSIALLLGFIGLTPLSAQAATIYAGNYADQGGSSNWSGAYLYTYKVTLARDGILDFAGFIGKTQVGSTGSVVLGIYADDGGSAGALISATNPIFVDENLQRYESSFLNQVAVSAGEYWFGTSANVSILYSGISAGSDSLDYVIHAYDGTLPDPAPAMSSMSLGPQTFYAAVTVAPEPSLGALPLALAGLIGTASFRRRQRRLRAGAGITLA